MLGNDGGQQHGTVSAGLAAAESSGPASLDTGGDAWTAIEGNPRWRDRELADIARDAGFARSLAVAYQRLGADLLGQLEGSFALCILEPASGHALLAVDRVGFRPLAYAPLGDGLVFGSRLDNIVAHPAGEWSISPQGIFDYLYFHMIPSPGTIYTGIRKLQPGEFVELRDRRLNTGFFRPLAFSEARRPRRELEQQLRDELERAVRNCLDERRSGTFLSGGLDSSTVTGVLQSLSGKPVDAFAIGFQAEGFDEMAYARATARHFGVDLHEYYVTPADVLDAIPRVTAAYDEPFGNASAIPAYYCAKFARENGIELLLAGDGGDEIFAGNSRYAKQKLFDLYGRVPAPLKKGLIEPLAFGLPPLRKLKSYIEQARIPMPARMETYNFLHRSPLEEIFNPAFLSRVDPQAPLRELEATYARGRTDSLVKKMLFLDHKITLADNDLRKVNRMCELAGVGVCYPLLQDGMFEFAATVPSDMLLRGFELRSFFRRAMGDFLAPETLRKSKHGFGLPFGLWLREDPELRAFADASLEQIRQREILNLDYIDNIIREQRQGHATYFGVMIWILVMLEQWLQSRGL